jgi:hypothetical protein
MPPPNGITYAMMVSSEPKGGKSMTTPISMLTIDLAKGSFQVCAIGLDGACVDAPLFGKHNL